MHHIDNKIFIIIIIILILFATFPLILCYINLIEDLIGYINKI